MGLSCPSINQKQARFIIFALAISATSFSVALKTILSDSDFPILFTTAFLLGLVCSVAALCGYYKPAVRIMGITLAAVISLGAMKPGIEQSWASSLAYIPAFVLLCLYFGGSRALRAAAVWSVALIAAWALSTEVWAITKVEFLTIVTGIVMSLLMTALLDTSLQFSIMDKVSLLRELQHRNGNGLQILLSLANHFDKTPTRELVSIFRAQLRAMAHVQDTISKGHDLDSLDMSGPLMAIARDIVSTFAPDSDIDIEIRSTMSLSVKKAIPIALAAVDIITNAVSGLGKEGHLSLGLSFADTKAVFSVSALDTNGIVRFICPETGSISGMVLEQIGAKPVPANGGNCWSIEFDPETEVSSQEDRKSVFTALWRKTRDDILPFLTGGTPRLRQSASRRMTQSLTAVLVVLSTFLALLTVASALVGDRIRTTSISFIAVSAAGIFLIRAGKPRWAQSLILVLLPFIYLLGILTAPGSSAGVQLYFLPTLILIYLYFKGRSGGIFASIFSVASFAIWYCFVPDRSLPLAATIDLAVAFFLFGVLVALLLNDFNKDLLAKEVLAQELQHRLNENLCLLDALLTATEEEWAQGKSLERLERFRVCVEDMSEINTLLSETPEMSAIPMVPALETIVHRFLTYADQDVPFIAAGSSGLLSAENACPALLLATELARQAKEATVNGDVFLISFRQSGNRAEMRTELRDGNGNLREAGIGEGLLIRLITEQLKATIGHTDPGTFSISFPV